MTSQGKRSSWVELLELVFKLPCSLEGGIWEKAADLPQASLSFSGLQQHPGSWLLGLDHGWQHPGPCQAQTLG